MRNFILAFVFAFLTMAAVPQAYADNETLFNDIRLELSELDILLNIVSNDGIKLGFFGVVLPLPTDVKNDMITRMLELRTSIISKVNQLAIE